jgi:EAL domain-containing protein (putative c-di-GMP-specific phosphodiesterase class I)/AmiR/NasT family two-component response regulator
MLLSDITILYVEDEKHSRRILGLILLDLVKEVFLASNGEEALEIYKEKKIDIILSDISMPIMDGIEMSIKVKEINKNQPIILLTASQNYKYLEKAIEVGVYRYLLKPILDRKELVFALEEVLDVINEQSNISKLLDNSFYHPTTLYKAYENNEFEVYYQPQINIITKKYAGVDALLRWNKDDDIVYPNSFILSAIKVGLMVMIDEWVLDTSIKQINELYQKGFNPGVLSVNLMIRSLENKNFIKNLKNIIEKNDFQVDLLEFKIREHDLMIMDEFLINKIREISSMGIRISIANFGKGFISYINKISIDKIKINKNYIDGIPKREESGLIINAILKLGEKLKIDVVAEGVETEEQLDFLIENKCYTIQGFLYSKALTIEQIEIDLLTN